MKNTVLSFQEAKNKGKKLTMLTAYDYSMAKLVDTAGVNAILVGDSLGMVMLGYEDTIRVTMEDMIHHTAAVSRGAKNALIIGDLPFLAYNTGIRDAVLNAGRLVQEGRANCVKLEGGKEVCDVIRAIVAAKIPVCAHIGLTPQAINALGGFRVQGKSLDSAKKLIEDAFAVQEAGAFAVVLECVPDALAKKITELLSIPTIGIGAGADCDGQVLVYHDMLGLYGEFSAKFMKRYANIGEQVVEGIQKYIEEVQKGKFPEEKHCFKIDKEIMNQL